ncbi:DNA alkylation repair protein [Mobilitalea sibirica]|uniref:DNA alkylation repair protein n=1 Tax=Mobilitalea sibirica TaxID=1462919 RepID=A0A8J7KWB7_9FIRM|nr:DNA alkylation repair protein [Mobilitalea sibirica]
MEKTIREQLREMSEEKYQRFSSSLTPGINNILGVRLPLLRKMAAKIAKEDYKFYLKYAEDETFEEVMLQGMVIGSCKAGIEEVLNMAADFIPKINNWSVCDSFCNGLKITKKHRERVWDFLQPYLRSDQEYDIRFGVVMLLHYYVLPEYTDKVFMHFNHIKHSGYYVKMAIAWAISVYFVLLPEKTKKYLLNNDLDDFTYNKALQKITESLRVDKETKAWVRGMKRK